MYATVPKAETKKREIRDAPTLFRATELCEDERLKLSINLSFACSLRIGELLGLTWDCVDISPESIAAGKASVFVNKELHRVSKSAMQTLEKKDVILVFPEIRANNKTVLVLIAFKRGGENVQNKGSKLPKEHILVRLSSSPSNERIVRMAGKMAQAFSGSLTALYVQTPGNADMNAVLLLY